MSVRTHRSSARAATSTVALLATLGVANAQTVEHLPPTGDGSSAATKVTDSPDDVVGVAVGLEFGFESLGSLIGADRFWCRVGGAVTESTFGFASITSDVSRSGSHGIGWNDQGVGVRWAKNAVVADELTGLMGAAIDTFPMAISGDGSVVVGTSRSLTDNLEPFVWNDGDAAVQALGLLPGSTRGYATDVTPDGDVIVGMCDTASGFQWCRWVNGGPAEALPVFGEVHGVSANGSVIVGRDENLRAVALVDGAFVDIGGNGIALAASDDGRVIVGSDAAGLRAWRWTARDGMQQLDDLLPANPVGGSYRAAAGVSPCGEIVVGWTGTVAVDESIAFVDAPDSPFDAFGFEAGGRTISGVIDGDPASDGRDAYLIEIVDPDAFYATTSAAVSSDAFADFDTRLWLFDDGGALVLANDDGPGGAPFHSTISDPADFTALTGGVVAPTALPVTLSPGRYVLVVSGFQDDPLNFGGAPVANLDSDFDALHGSDPVDPFFNAWDPGLHAGGTYTIALRGVALPDPWYREQRGFVATFDPLPDLDGDGAVGFSDLLAILSKWGPCSDCCPEDLDGDGIIGFADLLVVLSEWDG